MTKAWHNILQLWRGNSAFRAAAAYLLLLTLLVVILPLLPFPYEATSLDLANTFQPPFANAGAAGRHWLGTDSLGRDVLMATLYGARTALFISVPVMLLATAIGLFLGTSAGYYGEKGLRLRLKTLLVLLFGLLCLGYYAVYLPVQIVMLELEGTYLIESLAAGAVLVALFYGLLTLAQRFVPLLQRQVALPVDQLVLRLTEALATIPRFVLILVLASFLPPSVLLLSLIIAFTVWTNIARLARAEMMRIRELPYFEAAQSMGLTTWQLLWRQAMPNLLGPVLVAFTFGVGSLLGLEATLSFLNIGVPTTLVSWGSTISEVRSNTSAWWLVAFPGGLLTVTVLSLYTCSHYLAKIFHDKNTG